MFLFGFLARFQAMFLFFLLARLLKMLLFGNMAKGPAMRGNALDIPASVVWVADVDVTKLVLCVHRPDRQAHQGAAYKVKIA